MDYQGNANKNKPEAKPEKNIEKVVIGTVVVQKKSIGRKFKDLFIEADLKSVMRYVATDVLLPAARNMIVDGASKGVERLMYGESAIRRRNYGTGPRITYNNPINRDYRSSYPSRTAPPINTTSRTTKMSQDNIILETREEAENVLERLNDIIDTYEVATVGDLNELVGFESTFVDQKWGWIYLADVQIRQIREGFLIDLPPAEPVS